MAFAVVQPVQVLPRIRLAPGYALPGDDGSVLTSEAGRGTITLYSFLPGSCATEAASGSTPASGSMQVCAEVLDDVRTIRRRVAAEVDLAGTPFRTVTIVVGGQVGAADLARLAAAATAAEAPSPRLGPWRVVGGDAAQLANVVGLGFRRSTDPTNFRPSYAIVDGWGVIRREYRYDTVADTADTIVRHIDLLGAELRHDSGIGSWAYDAAHAFQCYP